MNATAAEARREQPDTFIRSARRKQLVRSAIEVIADLGVERASVVKIAQHAAVSRGVINYHFRDLDDLHDAVVAEVYRLGGEYMRDQVVAAASPRDALLTFVGLSVDFYAERPQHIAALREIFTLARRSADRSRSGTAAHTTELDDVAQLLLAGQEQGQFRTCDVVVVARAIRAVLDTAPAAIVPGADHTALRDELVAAVDALTRKGA